jgi:hypothetical protein
MKTILSITSVMILLVVFTSGCKKDSSNQDVLNANLKSTETRLVQSYQLAKTNDDLLKIHVTSGGHFTDPNTMMEDSLYHKNDSLCNQYYLTYCKDMIDGDNMMGGNMMGGNSMMHGSGMMATHNYMGGDTTAVNQCYRNLNTMRHGHSAHHPVK